MSLQGQQQPKSFLDSITIRGFKNRRYSRKSCKKLSYRQGKVYDEATPVIPEQSSLNQQQSSIINFLKHRNQFFTSSPSQEQETEKKDSWKHHRINNSLSFGKKTQNQENCWKHSPPSMAPQGFNSYQKFTTRIRPMVESMQSLSKRHIEPVEDYQSTEAPILLSEEHPLLEEIERLKKIKIPPPPQQDSNAVERRTTEPSKGKSNQLTLEEENYSQHFFDNTNQFKKEIENGLLLKGTDKNTLMAEPHRHSTESIGSQDSFYTAVSTLRAESSQSHKDE